MYHIRKYDDSLNPLIVCGAYDNSKTCQLIFREFRNRENGDKVIPACEVCPLCLNTMENTIEKNIRGLKRKLENLRIARGKNV